MGLALSKKTFFLVEGEGCKLIQLIVMLLARYNTVNFDMNY